MIRKIYKSRVPACVGPGILVFFKKCKKLFRCVVGCCESNRSPSELNPESDFLSLDSVSELRVSPSSDTERESVSGDGSFGGF